MSEKMHRCGKGALMCVYTSNERANAFPSWLSCGERTKGTRSRYVRAISASALLLALLEGRNRNALGLRFASFAKLYVANCTANESRARIAI